MKVLLVEDDRWLGECYLAWLQGFGYDVVWAQDAQSALDVLDDVRVDLIVLDIMLPFANGLHLMNVLASHADLSKIPVVVCSSMAPQGLENLYGVKAVLNKAEVTPRTMQTALAGALNNASV
jgi:DNA-binding response OmpR family regulator